MIREFEADDAADVLQLLREALPVYVQSEEGFLHHLSTEPARARARRWTAVRAHRVVGWGVARFDWAIERDDVGDIWVIVREAERGQGIGRDLYKLAERHLRSQGAARLESSASEEAGHRFLEARGFRAGRSERESALDPRACDLGGLPALEEEQRRAGFRVARLAELRGRDRQVYELYAAAESDMPADEPETNLSFEEWTEHVLEHPDLSHEGSAVVLADDLPVSLAFIEANLERGKASNDLTGTLPDFRRRGLARLAKMASIRWCAANGIDTVVTSNDSTNADMLAINEHLGYRPVALRTSYAKGV